MAKRLLKNLIRCATMIDNINNPEETVNDSQNNNNISSAEPIVPETETKVATEPVDAPAPATEEPATENSTPAKQAANEAKAKEQAERKARMDEIFAELKEIKSQEGTLEVEVVSRIKGGLRVIYKNLQLFLPASHFTVKRTPSEEELQEAIGAKFIVNIHEIQEMEDGRRAVIVSRKELLRKKFWEEIEVGKKVSGKVSSVASFGVFVDLGGIEGMIHVSRLSQTHVDDPAQLYKKGDPVEAVVVEINKETNRIGLSRKELEPSPWVDVDKEFIVGNKYKGIVRRITDFGVYIEMKQGVDGLMRTQEISWTKRIKNPGSLFTVGQEIEVEVLSVNMEKQNIALSYKRLTENPWAGLAAQFPVGTVMNGTVMQTLPQGAIISTEQFDGFMPKSKILSLDKGKKIPYEQGQTLEVKIADIVAEQESVIFEPAVQEEPQHESHGERFSKSNPKDMPSDSPISFLDLLSDSSKNNLNLNK